MRPLELRLRDFRSYRGEGHVFDFRDRRLVGIVGPIGSGKSSLLDAMSFALYGRTPSVGKAVRSLIHQRADGGAVSLRFEVDGEVWEVMRALRRKGQPQHILTLLSGDADDAEPLDKIIQEKEVTARVTELLGLDFDAFTRSVLLAQGRFAQFLSARPAERDAVLKGVFGHDRLGVMRDLARTRTAEAEAALAVVMGRLDRIDEVMADLADRKVQVAETTARLEMLEKAEPKLIDIDSRIVDASRRLEEISTTQATIDRLAAQVPKRPDVERLVAEGVGAERRRAELAERLEAAQADLQAAEKHAAREEQLRRTIEHAARLVALTPTLTKALAQVRERQQQMARLEATRQSEVKEADKRVSTTATALTAAQQGVADADKELAAAMAALDEGRHADMASALRTSLQTGDPCPVCDQDVHELPPRSSSVNLDGLERQVEKARRSLDLAEKARRGAADEAEAARIALKSATRDVAAAAEAHAAESEAVTEAEAALAAHDEEIADVLGSGDATAALSALRADLAELTERRDAARREVENVRRSHDEAIQAEQTVARNLAELQSTIGAVVTALSLEVSSPDGSAESIRRAFEELEAAWEARVGAADATRTAASEQLDSAREEKRELLAELEVEDFEAERTRARTTIELISAQIERDEEFVAAAANDISERDRLTLDVERYKQVGSDLTDSRFVRYLLDDERARLADLGSDHFQDLTSGRYRFSGEEFDIVDLAAAERLRKADSLSGGETFLASLALALGLAEMVSRSGGRLDAFFLDEGFGSLDPEHLSLAMDGIERLVTGDGDRLVVVVSHVAELRERIEDLIVLDKDPTTGDTVVRHG